MWANKVKKQAAYLVSLRQICQLAEKNPDVVFLQVNYEKHKSMCYSLHVHVLPFYRAGPPASAAPMQRHHLSLDRGVPIPTA
jgi:diadenosine tetraphosphate (Ap4A) HIT family hydrolase